MNEPKAIHQRDGEAVSANRAATPRNQTTEPRRTRRVQQLESLRALCASVLNLIGRSAAQPSRCLAASLSFALMLAAGAALADVSPPPAMAPDASNALLPNARSNLGLGTSTLPLGIRDDSSGTPASGGTGNAAGDQLTLADGCATHGVLAVSSVNTGAVTGYNIVARGVCATAPANPVGVASTTGTGSGATFTLNYGPLVAGLQFGSLSNNGGNFFLGGETPNAAYAGTESTFIGDRAGGRFGNGCNFNTATGHNALGVGAASSSINTNCGSNSAFGTDALRNYAGGTSLAAFGTSALKNQSQANGNNISAFGSNSMLNQNNGNSSNNSSAFGFASCQGAVGAGSFRTTSCFGANTGAALTSAVGSTLIGQGTGNTTFASGSDVLLIDSGSNSVDTPAAGSSHMVNLAKVMAGETVGVTNPALCAAGMKCVIGVLRGANFNIITDQPITIRPLTSSDTGFIAAAIKYFITDIYVANCSASLTTAKGGFYTATSKGGTIIGATTTPFTNCVSATTMQRLTGLTNQDSTVFNQATLYLSLTTAQGSAATGDVYVIGELVN